jgi:hypothetical protein
MVFGTPDDAPEFTARLEPEIVGCVLRPG